MSVRTIQMIVALIFVFAHIGAIALLVVLYMLGGFLFDEMTTSVAIIAPVLVGYSSAVFAWLRSPRPAGRSAAEGDLAFAWISLVLAVLFASALMGLVVSRAYNLGIGSFGEFKTLIAIVEGAFAVYFGPIVRTLFQRG